MKLLDVLESFMTTGVVRVLDLKSGGHKFKSRSDHYLVLFLVVTSSTPW